VALVKELASTLTLYEELDQRYVEGDLPTLEEWEDCRNRVHKVLAKAKEG